MKSRTVLRAAVLAAALAVGPSCKTPLAEGPVAARTNQSHAQKPHPCTREVIEGGLKSSCYVLFQKHGNIVTKKISKGAVRSQILLHHALSDLIKNYGVRVVLLEGAKISEDVRERIYSVCDKKCVNDMRTRFNCCIENVLHMSCDDNELVCKKVSGLLNREGARNFCLANAFLHNYHLTTFYKAFIMLQDPSVLFTGIERNPERLYQELKRHRLLQGHRNVIALFSTAFGDVFDNVITPIFRARVVEPRAKHVNKDAIMEVISYSFQDTALVIGVGHRERIEEAIRKIPFGERPTFNFIMPECQDVPAFSVSSKVINLAAKTVSETR